MSKEVNVHIITQVQNEGFQEVMHDVILQYENEGPQETIVFEKDLFPSNIKKEPVIKP